MAETNDATQDMRANLEVFAGRCPARPTWTEEEGDIFGPAMTANEIDSADLVIDLKTV